MSPKNQPRDGEALCLFLCNARPHAVRIDAVVEIIEQGDVMRIPLGPRQLVGLCSYRGGAVPITRSGDSDDAAGEPPARDTAILVLRTAQGTWGMLIDRSGVVVSDARRVHRFEHPENAGVLGLVGEVERAGARYTLIDPELTWTSIRSTIDRWYETLTHDTSQPGDRPPHETRSEPRAVHANGELITP